METKKQIDRSGVRNGMFKHGMTGSRLHYVWRAIKNRCYNKNNPEYKHYGGVGVILCDEWKNNFINFYTWAINNGYKETPTRRNEVEIDRRNTLGNYEPSNCWWTDHCINSQNKKLIMSSNTSGYRGIKFNENNSVNKWESWIGWNKKRHYLGSFSAPELAARAYNDFVIENHTAHPLNIIT
jgi:hypothetical protein